MVNGGGGAQGATDLMDIFVATVGLNVGQHEPAGGS